MGEPLVVDAFAGGGGASTGVEWALGRSPDIAINHDPEAMSVHEANHPRTKHLCGSVWDYRPWAVAAGRRIDVFWLSPDCTDHSKAKGSKPCRDPEKSRKRRGLAWIAVRYAAQVRPRLICLENVEEFEDWGPICKRTGKRDPVRAGIYFRRYVSMLRKHGYQVEWRHLHAHHYGAPTSRKRLFLIARCDGLPIRWPRPSHGPGMLPFRSAGSCINWRIPGGSIFTDKDLCANTMKRIAHGLRRFVLESPNPFVVPDADAASFMVHSGNGERKGQAPRVYDIAQPIGTLMAGGQKHALITAWVGKEFGGHSSPGSSMQLPLPTITTKDHNRVLRAIHAGEHSLRVRAFISQYNGTSIGSHLQMPLPTLTTRDRFALIGVEGEMAVGGVSDITHRMLVPTEQALCQGFPPGYILDAGPGGRTLPLSSQTRLVGNSVPPQFVEAIIRENYVGSRKSVAA